MDTTEKTIRQVTVNGTRHQLALGDNVTLLELVRDELGLTGTKCGCDMGTCGCCTVLVDGRPRLGCLTLAAQSEGCEITTVEALASGGLLHPLQAAFHAAGAQQCGFCTPGFLMTAAALLEQTPDPSEAEVREAISGNLCRCTGYQKIVEAILSAARTVAAPEGVA